MNSVTICNLALSHIGNYSISAFTDPTKEAKISKALYEPTLDALLRSFAWGFATKRKNLALLTETYSGYDFAYAYPTDCLNIIKIYNPNSGMINNYYNAVSFNFNERIEFDVIVNSDLNQRVILTNQEQAELVYTAKVEDANLFDPMFVDALSYKIATEMALPLKGNTTLQQGLYNITNMKIAQAQGMNANESYRRPATVRSSLTDIRN